MSFSDFSTAQRMRDSIRGIVKAVLEEERPQQKYATVQSVDVANRKASDIYTGDSVAVSVPYGIVIPVVGQQVIINGPEGDRRVVDAPSGADTGWLTPTYENSWVDYGAGYSGARYRKINGIVYMHGIIKSGTVGLVCAVRIPAGFRPSQTKRFPVESNTALGLARVNGTNDGTNFGGQGSLQIQAGNNTYVDLSPVIYPADA